MNVTDRRGNFVCYAERDGTWTASEEGDDSILDSCDQGRISD